MRPHTASVQQIPAHRAGSPTVGHLLAALIVALTAALAIAYDPSPSAASTPPAQATARTHAPAPVHPWVRASLPFTTTATWYGPGFYGNPTACGQRYSTRIRGIAIGRDDRGNYLARCGDRITVGYRGRAVHVRVIDRCPGCIVAAGSNHRFDLSARTAMDLCNCTRPYTMRVRWQRGHV